MSPDSTLQTAGNTQGLVLEKLSLILDGRELFSLDAEVGPGQVLTVMGPSGVGKSALVAAIAGFLPPAFSCSGRVLLDGDNITDLPAEERQIGVLFQDPLLFPHLSVGQNVQFALDPSLTGPARRQRVEAMLDDVELGGFYERDPATLSGGQKARVALLRTLSANPHALLLDEPFSKLDTKLRQSVRTQIISHIRRRALPTLLVTHDQADADAVGGPILTLNPQKI